MSKEAHAFRTFHAVVGCDEDGLATAALCRLRWPSYDAGDWDGLFERQGLCVNGFPVAAGTPVAAGDRITCTVPIGPEPPACTDYRILYRDAVVAVVEKPGNLPCHPAGRYFARTLERLLLARGDFPAVHLVNRLDRETSGLVLVALTADAASALGKAFMRHEVSKAYIAIVEGAFPDDLSTVPGWLYLAQGTTVRRKRVFLPLATEHPGAAQPVETQFHCLARRDGLSWLEVKPVTGRPHQIRATLKALGYPIVGDKLYGPDETIYARLCVDQLTALDHSRLRIARQALHAFRLSFRHPVTGGRMTFTSPLPDDLAAL